MNQPPPLYARRSTVGFWIVILLLLLGLLASIGLNTGLMVALMAKGGGPHLSSEDKGVDEFPTLTEVWSCGNGEVKAVRIALQGVIMRGGEETLLGNTPDRIEAILQEIRAAKNDEDVRAIILEVDSPGGGVTPSDEIYTALVDFRDSREDRVVIAFIRDMAASGGYYASVASDWIIAEPTAIVGSIGVILQTLNFKGLSEKIGVRDVTIKSGANKDLLNPFTEVSPEQLVFLQAMIDNSYQRFVGLVQESRSLDDEKMKTLADGRIFSSDHALQEGLIDQIGYWDDAVAKTAELLELESVKVIRYDRPADFFSWLNSVRLNLNPASLLVPERPRLNYLWQP